MRGRGSGGGGVVRGRRCEGREGSDAMRRGRWSCWARAERFGLLWIGMRVGGGWDDVREGGAGIAKVERR